VLSLAELLLRTAYISYWAYIIFTLIRLKYKEGRTTVCGRRSKRGWEREVLRRRKAGEEGEEEGLLTATE
jgi:high-affinity iron transporter